MKTNVDSIASIAPEIYEFGDFRLDGGRRLLLRRDGDPLPLTPKAFDTLLYLVQHPDSLLEKETLMKAIWPDTAVEENNLNQSISVLRRVLGGKRTKLRFIVTVPGRGYRFVAPVKRHRPLALPVAESLRSIAVLPFQPVLAADSDPSLEMGMADTLTARLSGIRNVIVRPMSAVRKYADLQQDALAAGHELGVESVLEGSLQRRDNRIRVTVRLLNVADGVSLWAGTFTEQMTDIFVLQDAISEQVVQALALELSSEDRTRLIKHHTENPRAYQLYLKGRYHWWKNSPEEYSRGREWFHRAVEEDPSYALGYCGLNSFYGFAAAWGMLPPDDGWPKAEWAVNKALELDDRLAEAHLGLAALKMVYYLDWTGAEQEARQTIELSPGFDEIHYFYSFFLVVMGRFDEAISEGQRALKCNPFSVRISQHLAYCLYCASRCDEAIRQYWKTLQLDPNNAAAHEALGDLFERKGQYREAFEQWHKSMTLVGDTDLAATLASANADFPVAVRAVAIKRLARLNDRRNRGEYLPAAHFAREHLRAGDREQTLKYLKLACEERNVYSLMIGSDPLYDEVRGDPQFINLIQRMKLGGPG
jgi:DNA-binding winged helix-turn-helix (wHTH) protein/tetratricopeptide (TPR) repeat protein